MIYLDHAATTPCRPEVVEAMLPALAETFGNPSSVHRLGQDARTLLDRSRDRVAALLGARQEELIFTGGGTEADNLAMIGAWQQEQSRGGSATRRNHLITAASEHHAVLHTAEWLRSQGCEVTVLPVDREGRVDLDRLRESVRPTTFLVTLMAANNEIGTLLPVEAVGRICREAGVLFHTDAVQWAGALPFRPADWGADLVSITAHKFYGPKGTGLLYCRRGVRLKPILHGGGQERARRPGTENVAGIAGFARAFELAVEELSQTPVRIAGLRNRLLERLRASIDDVHLNGPEAGRPDAEPVRLPNNLNVSIPGAESDMLLLNLDLEGVAASSGSACTAGAIEPSHVLKAIGIPHERQVSAVRLTLGRGTTVEEVDRAVEIIGRVARRVRQALQPARSAA